ncbi:hypothetical protein N9H39_09875 [Gammaproteobacteria bacterium]|nr:hypothetical protein [Gammaproteobacteria bacterium]
MAEDIPHPIPTIDTMDNADDIELMVIELHQQTIDLLKVGL